MPKVKECAFSAANFGYQRKAGQPARPVGAGLKPASTLDCGIAIGTKWRKVSRFMLVALILSLAKKQSKLIKYEVSKGS
jgi:hypothetical protein